MKACYSQVCFYNVYVKQKTQLKLMNDMIDFLSV